MAAVGFFAVDKCIACLYFTTPTAGRTQGEAFDKGRIFLGQLGRQTDSTWGIVSHHTIFDTQLELLQLQLLFAQFTGSFGEGDIYRNYPT